MAASACQNYFRIRLGFCDFGNNLIAGGPRNSDVQQYPVYLVRMKDIDCSGSHRLIRILQNRSCGALWPRRASKVFIFHAENRRVQRWFRKRLLGRE
jgi:hypothetical protein